MMKELEDLTLREFRETQIKYQSQIQDPWDRERELSQTYAMTTGANPYHAQQRMVRQGKIPAWFHLEDLPGSAKEVVDQWFLGDTDIKDDSPAPFEIWGRDYDQRTRKDSLRSELPMLTKQEIRRMVTIH
jgi:hypothetical protein